MKDLIKLLCDIDGVSGYEDNVRSIIEDMVRPHVDSIYIDPLGSLIVFKKGLRPRKKNVMICAHTDEIGALVFRITETGLLKMTNVGALDPRVCVGQRMRIGNNKIKGVVSTKAIQLTTDEERKMAPSLEDLYIDIGARNRIEAQHYVRIGDPIVFDSECCEFGANRLKAKALDDRVGCAVMVTLLREDLPFSTWFAFSSCEEIGLRGAAALTERVQPDYSLVLEGTTAADMPDIPPVRHSTHQGGGAAISMADGGTIYDRELIKRMTERANQEGIRWQFRCSDNGRTDAGSINSRAGGSKVLGVSVPTRYIHCANSIVYLPDVMDVLRMTRLFIRETGE